MPCDEKQLEEIIDLTLYILFCALAGNGLLLALRIPHGAGRTAALTFLGHGLHDWAVVHTWLAYASLGLVAVHLLLNREWLVRIAATKGLWRLAVSLPTGLLVVGAFLLLPIQEIEPGSENFRHRDGSRLSEPGGRIAPVIRDFLLLP